MPKYFHVFNNEAAVPSADSWLATQDRLGCVLCGRVETPYVVHAELDAELGYVNNFTNLTTQTRRLRPKSDIGGSITMIASIVLEAIGRKLIDEHFLVGSIAVNSKLIDSHCTLVPRFPEDALWIRSKSPLRAFSCSLCGSELHAHDGLAFVTEALFNRIYPVACNGNALVVDSNVAQRLQALQMTELIIEPIEITSKIA